MSEDLFTRAERFPDAPGFKRAGTSSEAARKIRDKATTLKAKMLALYETGVELTADEAAQRLGVSVLSARPRCAELYRLGIIKETGERRVNASGMRASVWRIA